MRHLPPVEVIDSPLIARLTRRYGKQRVAVRHRLTAPHLAFGALVIAATVWCLVAFFATLIG